MGAEENLTLLSVRKEDRCHDTARHSSLLLELSVETLLRAGCDCMSGDSLVALPSVNQNQRGSQRTRHSKDLATELQHVHSFLGS